MNFEEIRVKDVRAILRYRSNGTKWSAKNRKAHFIGIQLNGSALHKFDHHEFVLSRNCVYFFNQKENYEVELYDPCESFSVHFTTYGEIETESFCIPVENPEEFLSLLQKAEQLKQTSAEGDLALLSTVYKLCDLLSRTRHRAYVQKDARILRAKAYMDANYKGGTCLAEAIAQSGLSARRFGDLFRDMFGLSPNRYLILRRIEQAKSMLETNCLSVTEVAELCGFSDVYYFSKVFKQICGVSPSRWK